MSDAQVPAPAPVAAPYDLLGGEAGVRRLVDAFYDQMESDPDAAGVRGLHGPDLALARDRLADWLSGWLGGPRLFSERYGPIAIPAFHAQWPIDEGHSQAWLDCMAGAIARQPFKADFAEYLLTQLHVPAGRIVQASRARREKD